MSGTLLPSNATPLQRTIDEAAAAAVDLPVPIADLVDAYRVPATALPFTAWGRSIDLWDDAWPDERKRDVVDQFHDLHRFKGTRGGIQRLVNLTSAKVIRWTVPPQGFYPGDGSAALWERWLLSLRELRLYTLDTHEIAVGVTSAADADEALLCAAAFLGEEDSGAPTMFVAGEQPLEHAAIVDGDEEIPIHFFRQPDTRFGRVGDVWHFAWPQDAGLSAYADTFWDGRFFRGSPADLAFVAVHFVDGEARDDAWNLATPSPYVQDVAPRIGSVERSGRIGVYADTFWAGRYLSGEGNVVGSYRSLRLLEGKASFGMPASFAGFSRLGFPAYTAELLTELPGTLHHQALVPAAAFAGATYPGDGPDLAALRQVCAAVTAGKALRDRVYLDLNVPNPGALATARAWAEVSL